MVKPFIFDQEFGQKSAGGPSQRQLRVAEEIRHSLAEIFTKTEFRDTELRNKYLTVTEVKMSPDLRLATVYFTRLGHNDAAELVPALKRVSSFLRGQLSSRLKLKFLPELHFIADTSLEYAAKIDNLLHRSEVRRDLEKNDS